MSGETIRMGISSESRVRRFRERQPEEVVEAIHYDGSFPLEFLAKGERVRAAVDVEGIDDSKGMAEVVAAHGGVIGRVRPGEWLLRFPTLGLRNYSAESFEETFEEVPGAEGDQG